MKSALIHGVLLAVMLVYGYRTWTRDKTVQTNLGSVVLWDKTEADLVSIEYSTDKTERQAAGASRQKKKTVRSSVERALAARTGGAPRRTDREEARSRPEPPKPEPAAGPAARHGQRSGSGSAAGSAAGSGSGSAAKNAGSGSAACGRQRQRRQR